MADRPDQNLEDTIRRHHAAFFDWFGQFRVDYGALGLGLAEGVNNPYAPIPRNDVPILRIFGPPQRVAAEMVDILVEYGWLQGQSAAAQAATATELREIARENHAVLPMPFLSMVADAPVFRIEDNGPPKLFRRQCFDEATQTFQQHRWPGSYEISFRVTLHAIKRYTVAYFREWLFSQLGPVGMGGQELLIPVQHEYPWNEIRQALSFDGESDLSDLEGEENARTLRFQYDFRLKMWHFHRIAGSVSVIEDVSAPVSPVASDGIGLEDAELGASLPVEADALSLNFFEIYLLDSQIPTQWPKLGNATVRRGETSPVKQFPVPTLRMTVEDPTDEVLISNKSALLDADGIAVFTHRLDYRSDAATEIVYAQREGADIQGVFETARVQALPARANWTRHQGFVLFDKPIHSITLRGSGAPAVAHLSRQRLHKINLTNKLTPTTSAPGGGQTVHTWAGLEQRPYLAIVHFTDAGVTGMAINVNGDSIPIDNAAEQGLVRIFTVGASLAATVTIPDTIPIQGVWLIRYKGFWDGSEI